MPQIVACPLCHKQLQLPDSFVGKMVQCPECKHGFKATVNDDPIPMKPDEPSGKVPEWEKMPASNADDEKPSSRRRLSDPESEEDEPPRKARRASADEDLGEPSRRRRRYYAPHRAGTVLALGIMALVCCPAFIIGPIAWSMANGDLTEIRAGRMDPEGEKMTQAGRTCGILGTVLSMLGFCLFSSFCLLSNAPMFRRR